MDKEFLEECLDRGMSLRQIEQNCDKHRNTIRYWIQKYQLQYPATHRKQQPYRFDVIDTKEKAYMLGFILGDGHINKKDNVSICVSMRDREVVEFIAQILQSRIWYDNTMDRRTKRFPRVTTRLKIKDIRKFTGGRLKTERHYPRVAHNLERYLIQGFFDAEGCMTWGWRKDRHRIWQKITFTSQFNLLFGVQQYLYNNLNIATTLRPKSDSQCYVLAFARRDDVLKFCQHIYPDKDFIILHRKYLKYEALRLELEENGESGQSQQYRAEPAEQEGVETSGAVAI